MHVYEFRLRVLDYFGVGSAWKFLDLIKAWLAKGIKRIMVVAGRSSYKTSGAWDIVKKVLDSNDVSYILYDKVLPNPTTDVVDEVAKYGLEFGAEGIVAIGGGSVIDVGKLATVLLENPSKNTEDLLLLKFRPAKSLPLIAVNLTHGTGSEVNRYAVATLQEKNYRLNVGLDILYPEFSIDDPSLVLSLPRDQSIYAAVTALAHAIEAATSRSTNPFTVLVASESVKTIHQYLPKVLTDPHNVDLRTKLLYASVLAGIATDNSRTHLSYVLESPLSALRLDIPYGLGLAILLPHTLELVYSASSDILDQVLAPFCNGFVNPVEGLTHWLAELGLQHRLSDLSFGSDDVQTLTRLVFETPGLKNLLNLAPIEVNEEIVKSVYMKAL